MRTLLDLRMCRCELFRYQRRALSWMVYRESQALGHAHTGSTTAAVGTSRSHSVGEEFVECDLLWHLARIQVCWGYACACMLVALQAAARTYVAQMHGNICQTLQCFIAKRDGMCIGL